MINLQMKQKLINKLKVINSKNLYYHYNIFKIVYFLMNYQI